MSEQTCSPLIDSYLPQFNLSEPVFKIGYDDYWNCVRISHAVECKASLPQAQENAIANLGVSEFSERFDDNTKTFTYDRSILIGKTLSKCVSILISFFVNHSALKKPKMSSTYNFLCSLRDKATNSDLNDDVARLTRYILEHQADNRHKTNALALINALKDKYE